jgi:hypothetical protein
LFALSNYCAPIARAENIAPKANRISDELAISDIGEGGHEPRADEALTEARREGAVLTGRLYELDCITQKSFPNGGLWRLIDFFECFGRDQDVPVGSHPDLEHMHKRLGIERCCAVQIGRSRLLLENLLVLFDKQIHDIRI